MTQSKVYLVNTRMSYRKSERETPNFINKKRLKHKNEKKWKK